MKPSLVGWFASVFVLALILILVGVSVITMPHQTISPEDQLLAEKLAPIIAAGGAVNIAFGSSRPTDGEILLDVLGSLAVTLGTLLLVYIFSVFDETFQRMQDADDASWSPDPQIQK